MQMIARQNTVLFGYFGGWNSGDEAILDSVEKLLGWGDPAPSNPAEHVAVICLSTRDKVDELYHQRGRFIVPAKDLIGIFRLLRTRQLVIGGGQIITGDRTVKGLLYLLVLTAIARLTGRPAVMVGIGVEGVHRMFAKLICRAIAANVARIHCRDEYSLQMLRFAGCREEKLRLAADVVLSGAIARDPNHAPPPDLPVIAIGLHHAKNWRNYTSSDEIKSLAMTLADSFPMHRVLLVSNDCRKRFDEGLLDSLKSSLHHERIGFQSFDDVEQIMKSYATAKLVISVRMHPLILALIHGVPVVGVARSNKVKQLAQRLQFDLIDPSVDSPDSVVHCVRNAMASPVPNLSAVQLLANQQFSFAR